MIGKKECSSQSYSVHNCFNMNAFHDMEWGK